MRIMLMLALSASALAEAPPHVHGTEYCDHVLVNGAWESASEARKRCGKKPRRNYALMCTGEIGDGLWVRKTPEPKVYKTGPGAPAHPSIPGPPARPSQSTRSRTMPGPDSGPEPLAIPHRGSQEHSSPSAMHSRTVSRSDPYGDALRNTQAVGAYEERLAQQELELRRARAAVLRPAAVPTPDPVEEMTVDEAIEELDALDEETTGTEGGDE